MLFVSPSFAAFFAVFFVAFRFVARSRRAKIAWLLLGSVFFYATWDPRFVPLLVGAAAIDYFIALKIAAEPARKRAWFYLSFVLNLGALVYFKYLEFFSGIAFSALRAIGLPIHAAPVFDILIPVGISFYSFQRLAYVIDVYSGELAPCHDLVEFLASVTFFPHLVAGPIIRANVLLPQLEVIRTPPREEIREAFLLICAGFMKKSLSDLLSAHADAVFAQVAPSTRDAWTGTLAFVGQIYGDFSGYTDMAIGIALVLGFRLPPNFRLPFLARSPAEFWAKHWHLSLTSWIRDYVYLPLAMALGRLRSGTGLLAILLTMALMGLWHGGAWTFVVFGIYSGVIVAGTHFFDRRLIGTPSAPAWFSTPVKIVFTYYLTTIGFLIFRAKSLSQIGTMLASLHGHTLGVVTTPSQPLAMVCSTLLGLYVVGFVVEHFKPDVIRSSLISFLACAFLAVAGALAYLFSAELGVNDQPFMYFRF